jgi:osmoprotectant transport system permease protein
MRTDFDDKPLRHLSNRLNEAAMAKLNGQAEAGANFEQVARTFLNSASVQESNASTSSRFFKLLLGPDFFTALRDHVLLVVISSTLALFVGIPLGVLAQRRPRFAVWILGAAGILQTIPSLALLTILIAALDQIGAVPAVIALFLYGLLPIVNATHIGLMEVPANLKEAALAATIRTVGHHDWPCIRYRHRRRHLHPSSPCWRWWLR